MDVYRKLGIGYGLFFYIPSFSDRLSTTLHKIHYESHRENMPPILQFDFSTNVPWYCITLVLFSSHCTYAT